MRRRLEAAGWSKTNRWDWNLYWRPQVPSLAAYGSLRPGMRVNHIPGIAAITSPRLLRATLVQAGVADLLSEDDGAEDEEAPGLLSRFVLVSGVDPLRIYVHSSDADGADEGEIARVIRRTVLAGRDVMTRLVRDHVAERDACFELLRFDFRRDVQRATDGRLRLVRCALSSSLEESQAALVDDTLALLGILPLRARTDAGLEASWCDVANDELTDAGGYRRIIPSKEPAVMAVEWPFPRHSDVVLAEREGACSRDEHHVELEATSTFLAGRVVLFSPSTQRFFVPNDTAAYVWLRLEDGASPGTIANELHLQFSVPLATVRCDVWDIVARWAHDGLVRRADRGAVASSPTSGHSALGEGEGGASEIAIAGSPDEGFRITSGWGVRAECRSEAEIAPLVRRFLALDARRRATGVVAITGVAVSPRREGDLGGRESASSIVLAGPETLGGGALAALLHARGYSVQASPVVLIDQDTGAPLPLPLALEISELDQHTVRTVVPAIDALASWTLPAEILAKYLPFTVPEGPVAPVAALVFVRRAAPETPAALATIDCLAALEELTRQGFGGSPAMTSSSAARFLAWLERTPCFDLVAGTDLVSAADSIEALLRGLR